MNEHDAQRQCGRLFAAMFPGGGWREDSFEIYVKVIGDLPRELGDEIVDRLINRYATMPRIAEIRMEVAEQTLGLPTAAEAWEQAMNVSQERHPLVVQLMASFGGSYTMRVDDNPGLLRNQFMKQFDLMRSREIARFDMRDLELAPV